MSDNEQDSADDDWGDFYEQPEQASWFAHLDSEKRKSHPFQMMYNEFNQQGIKKQKKISAPSMRLRLEEERQLKEQQDMDYALALSLQEMKTEHETKLQSVEPVTQKVETEKDVFKRFDVVLDSSDCLRLRIRGPSGQIVPLYVNSNEMVREVLPYLSYKMGMVLTGLAFDHKQIENNVSFNVCCIRNQSTLNVVT